jgi:hypothetical protein
MVCYPTLTSYFLSIRCLNKFPFEHIPVPIYTFTPATNHNVVTAIYMITCSGFILVAYMYHPGIHVSCCLLLLVSYMQEPVDTAMYAIPPFLVVPGICPSCWINNKAKLIDNHLSVLFIHAVSEIPVIFSIHWG